MLNFEGVDSVGMGVACLRLLLQLGRGRGKVGASAAQVLRAETVGWLAAHPEGLSFSQVAERLSPSQAKEEEELRALLERVAEKEHDAARGSTKYKLKPELWAEVDRFFARYSARDLAAVDAQLQSGGHGHSRSGEKEETKGCYCGVPLPLSEELFPQFKQLPSRIFRSATLLRVVFRYIMPAERLRAR